MRTSTLMLFIILFASQVYGNLLDGLEHHGHHADHHGDHGEHHGDHGHHGEHGEHAHGDHARGDHGNHAHGEHAHGDHAHGEQGEHAHGQHEHGEEHSHGEDHSHNEEDNAINQDSFASALASDLNGGFFSSLPADAALAPAETFVAPAESFVAPALTTEATEIFATPTPAVDIFVAPVEVQQQQQQQQHLIAQENAIQFPEMEESPVVSSSGEAKQLATAIVNEGRTTGDYPEYATVPQTSFSCAAQETGGYFADPEAQCQAFHICLNGQNLGSFLCPNGTLFHQQYFVCDWWFNVDCGASAQSYGLNARIGVVPESE